MHFSELFFSIPQSVVSLAGTKLQEGVSLELLERVKTHLSPNSSKVCLTPTA